MSEVQPMPTIRAGWLRYQMTRARLHVKALRLALDPETKRWHEAARKRMADSSFPEQVRAQPSPHELAEAWRRKHHPDPGRLV